MSNAGLAFDTDFQARAQAEANGERDAQRRKQSGPSLRWRLRETEGSYWLSYRPIIKVELVTPAISVRVHEAALGYPPDEIDALPPPPPPLDEEPLEAPALAPTAAAGDAEVDSARPRLAPAYTE